MYGARPSPILERMCRVLKVILVAAPERQLELRRALSSIEYEIVGAFALVAEIDAAADVAVVWEPNREDVAALADRGLKVVAVGGEGAESDLALSTDDLATFKQRVWELFKPQA